MLFKNLLFIFLSSFSLQIFFSTCNQWLGLYVLLLEYNREGEPNLPCLDQLRKWILIVKISNCPHHCTNINKSKANISVGCAHTRSTVLRNSSMRQNILSISLFLMSRESSCFSQHCQKLICKPHFTFEMNWLLSYILQTYKRLSPIHLALGLIVNHVRYVL